MLVCKFGGSVLPDAAGFARAAEVIRQNPHRRYIIVSAPGKRHAQDEKITDLLYACQSAAWQGRGFARIFEKIAERFRDLGVDQQTLDGVCETLKTAAPALAASRGEYLSAHVMSRLTGYPVVDAQDLIRFDADGALNEAQTRQLIASRLRDVPRAVIPGFYGADQNGLIHTFSRGGSDVTAALIAAALNASACENWKDVRGVFAADPRLVPDARVIPDMTYAELETLSRFGAQVLCPEAVKPLRQAGVALNIRSLNDVSHPGTWITAARRSLMPLTGITGKQCRGLALVTAVGPWPSKPEGMARLILALRRQDIAIHALHQPLRGGYACAVVDPLDFPRALRAAYDSFIRN